MPLIINIVVAMVAYRLKILNISGIFLAYAIGCILLFYRYDAYIILLVFLLVETIVESLFLGKANREKRNKSQVLCNSIAALISILINYFTKNENYYIIYTTVISCSLGDSMASTIGRKYARNVYSITSLKKVDKDLSGGVSVIGTISGLIGNIIIGIIFYILSFGKNSFFSMYIIIYFGFMGMLIDSILGDLFQKKYRCIICEKNTDESICCGRKTTKVRGYLTNNEVNLLSTVLVFIITWICLEQ